MMKIKSVMTCIIVGVSLCNLAWADSTGTAQLSAVFTNVKTLQGAFKQTLYDQQHHVLDVSQGDFIIQRPNQFRWQVATPMAQLTVTDGKTVWVYQPDLEQVTKSHLTQQIGQTPLAILSGSTEALSSNFNITATDAEHFTLVAKNDSGGFAKILLTMHGSAPVRMELFDNLDQTTVLDFSKVSVNKTFKSSIFTFVIPKGVDVVQN